MVELEYKEVLEPGSCLGKFLLQTMDSNWPSLKVGNRLLLGQAFCHLDALWDLLQQELVELITSFASFHRI